MLENRKGVESLGGEGLGNGREWAGKVRGGRYGFMGKKSLESSRVWAWIKFVEISGVCGRGKCSRVWAWKVRGKFEGMGVESAWVWALKVR